MNSMIEERVGRFWAVGVGPGDPELLTQKAARLIQQAAVIYHAGPTPEQGRALDTIRSLLQPRQELRIVLRNPMADVTAGDWRRYYGPGVDEMATECRAGRKVVFITEGDPTLYSTAAHVWQLLAERHSEIPIEVVPGVSSITAAAARVRWPLAQKDESLAIVPGSYHQHDLADWLDRFSTVCVLKPAKALAELEDAVKRLPAQPEAVYAENIGTPREWLTHDLTAALGRHEYFSLVIVRSQELSPRRLPTGGKVDVVGIGPGDPTLLTQHGLKVLREADVIVGYEMYLRALEPLHLRAELIASPIGEETERAQKALELARSGRRVALVSSGDAGVYGMASVLLETAETLPELAIAVTPGVTAATAAAALLGAPLSHDFACISLSDLLTPWDVIERRLEAAARADFVLAIYNPISLRRTWQLPRTREILLNHRKPETPVGLVDKAHRPGMRVWQTTLGELTTDGISMETMIIVGNSQTRAINGRMVTPRGYETGGAVRRPAEVGGRPGACPTSPIMEQSFAIIERELGQTSLPPWAFAVIRRMIHASADFDFARTLRYSNDFETAIAQNFRDRMPIVTDTEMVQIGIRTALRRADFQSARTEGRIENPPCIELVCHLNDSETARVAETVGLTHSAAGIRVTAQQHRSPIVVIGNAPTALEEALRLVDQENWRPAAIIGMPVGFVGVDEAKGRLLAQTKVPYLTCTGRKGGSAVAAAAVNALIEWVSSQ
jgi:precorrin-2 C(20)-methyltransferase